MKTHAPPGYAGNLSESAPALTARAMRFFTIEWWHKQQVGEASDPFDAYDAHLRSIEADVPPALTALVRRGVLHDGKVRHWRLDVSSRSLDVELTACETDGRHVTIRLRYDGVRTVTSCADPELGLPGPGGYGDLGYTEVHLVDGKPQHWLLFSSGIEIQIAFESFDARTERIENRG